MVLAAAEAAAHTFQRTAGIHVRGALKNAEGIVCVNDLWRDPWRIDPHEPLLTIGTTDWFHNVEIHIVYGCGHCCAIVLSGLG
jgi:hypothetical protein